VEFGIVVDVEFVGGRFVVIWDIVNDIRFHFISVRGRLRILGNIRGLIRASILFQELNRLTIVWGTGCTIECADGFEYERP
jgi:hypothetical protein